MTLKTISSNNPHGELDIDYTDDDDWICITQGQQFIHMDRKAALELAETLNVCCNKPKELGPFICPCKDETVDPCPACGATISGHDPVGGICQARK